MNDVKAHEEEGVSLIIMNFSNEKQTCPSSLSYLTILELFSVNLMQDVIFAETSKGS